MQELLPELPAVNNKPPGNADGIFISQTVNNYYSISDQTKDLDLKIKALEKELERLRGKGLVLEIVDCRFRSFRTNFCTFDIY